MNFTKTKPRSKTAENGVDLQTAKTTTEVEPRMRGFVRIIRWQSRIILLFLVMVALLVLWQASGMPLNWPKHDVQTVAFYPPVNEDSVQYKIFAYAGTELVPDNTTTDKENITLMGQIFDYATIKEKWPDVAMLINGAAIPMSSAGNCLAHYKLKPGDNTFDTTVILDGTELGRKQTRIRYKPNK